jgi:excinuclease ABC subunit C
VRDEAHRFAIAYHRSKRSKRMTASALDSVRGLGETRRAALVRHFGSIANLRQATVEEITAVPGIGVATATAVLEALGVEPADSVGTNAETAAMSDDHTRASG